MRIESPELQREADLEALVLAHPSLLGRRLWIVDSQVHVAGRDGSRKRVDFLAIDERGVLWVIELKVGVTEPDILAQVSDYGIRIQEGGLDGIVSHIESKRGVILAERLGSRLAAVGSGKPRIKLMIVAAGVDRDTAEAMTEMQRHDIPIEAVTFTFDLASSTYEFTPRAALPGAGPKRRHGSSTLYTDLESMRAATWSGADAVEKVFGQPPQGAFIHRTNVRIDNTDPLALSEWALFVAQFTGRCVPTRFLRMKYLATWPTLAHPRADEQPLDLRRFGTHLKKAAARTPGWAPVRNLDQRSIERERERLTALFPAWSTVRVEPWWSGYIRTQEL